MQQNNCIECRGLALYAGDEAILEDVDLAVPAGQVTGLLGGAGCGKTALLTVLDRMDAEDPRLRARGQVVYRGRNILARNTDLGALRREIGMVFSEPAPFAGSVGRNLTYAARLCGHKTKAGQDQAARTALQRMGVWDEWKHRLRENALALARADRQVLCIARCLCTDPRLLLLDEPTLGLDDEAARKVEGIIEALRAGCSILLATRSARLAARACDWCAFMQGGRVLEFAKGRKLFAGPAHPAAAAYVTGREAKETQIIDCPKDGGLDEIPHEARGPAGRHI